MCGQWVVAELDEDVDEVEVEEDEEESSVEEQCCISREEVV